MEGLLSPMRLYHVRWRYMRARRSLGAPFLLDDDRMADVSTLIQQRYGSDVSGSSPARANETLELMLQHKSVRHFLPEPVSTETLRTIVAAAQSAPSSSNLQTWSVVAIRDPQRKDKAAYLSGNQDFIRQAPLLLVFCADLHRLTKVSGRQLGKPGSGLDYTEMFLVASVDAALAAQNALTSAESLGLGACYVGAARNQPQEMAALLGLPPRAIALFGLAIGTPDPAHGGAVKPRLPQSEVLHLETWHEPADSARITEYDEVLAKFNASQNRENAPTWSEASSARVATPKALFGREVLRDILTSRGFDLK